jgi:hypothetical protein
MRLPPWPLGGRSARQPPTFVSMNITSAITSNSDGLTIPSEASRQTPNLGQPLRKYSETRASAQRCEHPLLSTLISLNAMEQSSASKKRKRTNCCNSPTTTGLRGVCSWRWRWWNQHHPRSSGCVFPHQPRKSNHGHWYPVRRRAVTSAYILTDRVPTSRTCLRGTADARRSLP